MDRSYVSGLERGEFNVPLLALPRGHFPEFAIAGAGNGARLFVTQDQRPEVPPWVSLFEGQLQLDRLGETASVSAVFVLRVADRFFALTFGGGRFLLEDDWIE